MVTRAADKPMDSTRTIDGSREGDLVSPALLKKVLEAAATGPTTPTQTQPFKAQSGGLPPQTPQLDVRGAGTEAGHGDKTDPAMVKYEEDVAARNRVIQENAEIQVQNAPIEGEIAELEDELRHLKKLFSHDKAKFDDVLTWSELEDLAMKSSDPAQREAALWLLARPQLFNSFTKKSTLFGGEGIEVTSAGSGRLAMNSAKLSRLKKQLKPLKDVPPEPVRPGPASGSNASTGTGSTQGSATTGNGGSTTVPTSTGSTGSSETASLAGTSAGLVGLGEGIDGIQAEITRLVEDTKKNPQNANANQAKITQLSNQVTMLSALMNQLFTMQSNLAKLMSEMAMTAVRNMR